MSKLSRKHKQNYKNRKRSLIKNKRGGGYNSSLSVNQDIDKVCKTNEFDYDRSLQFTITNIDSDEPATIYNNIRFLGEGIYGKVFLVTHSDSEFVIKIGHKYPDYILNEPRSLDIIMQRVIPSCNYKAISQGITTINLEGRITFKIGNMVFPYKGDYNLEQIVADRTKISLIPSILRDVLTCLIDINKYGYHGDLKLDNIVYDAKTKTGFIIDFGLAFPYDIQLSTLYSANIGKKQLSVDIIIGYLIWKVKGYNLYLLNKLYYEHLDIIQKTIDNFGLFWLILESISTIDANAYLINDPSEFLIHITTQPIFDIYLNFYFNLDILETPLTLELRKLFNYKPVPNFREKFIDKIQTKITHEKFAMYFDNDRTIFRSFIEKILLLVAVDPNTRISKDALLAEPFFHK